MVYIFNILVDYKIGIDNKGKACYNLLEYINYIYK
jgi:hypothetical protein